MKKNIGTKDKNIRIVIGLISIILGLMVSKWFFAIAVLAFVTAFSGYCLLYSLIGKNTCDTK